MAEIVFGMAVPHSGMLGQAPEDWLANGERDRNNPELWFRNRTWTYPELEAERGAAFEPFLTLALALALALARAIATSVSADALIVVRVRRVTAPISALGRNNRCTVRVRVAAPGECNDGSLNAHCPARDSQLAELARRQRQQQPRSPGAFVKRTNCRCRCRASP